VLALLAASETVWAHTRASLGVLLVFSTGALAATLLHRDRSHRDRFFGWVWLAVYILLPPAILVPFGLPTRIGGGDPPRVAPMAPGVRVVIGVQAALLLGVAWVPDSVAPRHAAARP